MKPQIERNLVVPAARSMKLCACSANSLRKRSFDIHVHVFEGAVPLEFARFDFFFDSTQLGFNFLQFINGNDSCASQRCAVGDRPSDVVAIKPAIKGNRFAIALRNLCSRFFESPFAHG